METNSALVKTQPILIDEKVKHAWILAGNQKAAIAKFQQQKSLELQEIILNARESIADLNEDLTKYRKIHSEMVNAGKSFRGWLSGLALQPSLDIESEYDPKKNDDYLQLDKKLLQMRVSQDENRRASQAKEQEKQLYAAHVKNQYETIVADFEIRARHEITTMYITYLKDKVKKPDINIIKATIQGLEFNKGQKFEAKYLSVEDKKAIVEGIPKPDQTAIRQKMIDLVDEKFASYQHDLKANTIEQIQEQESREIQEIQQEAQANIGVNLLAAKAVEIPFVAPEGKAIKRSVEVVIEGTEQWCMLVIAAFLKAPLCRSYVTVKRWENLTVTQMAGALGKWASESGEVDPSLTYREIVK